MKSILLLIVGLYLTIVLQAQVLKTVEVTAGGLSSALTDTELNTITHLTLTGTMNALDISTIQNQMPSLTELDMSGSIIAACTIPSVGNFRANWFPGPSISKNSLNYGGISKPLLTRLQLPSTLEVIGSGGISGCSGLTGITIPPMVTTIGWSAFEGCSALTSLNIPSSVTHIDEWAFYFCSGLTEVTLPTSITYLSRGVFEGCSALTSITIPPSVTTIDDSAFRLCNGLTKLVLPASVEYIQYGAFIQSPNLRSIYSYRSVPAFITSASFDDVVKSNSILYVPFGSVDLYASAQGWQDFTHIVEMADFRLSPTSLTFESARDTAKVELTSGAAWTVSSDQSWVTIKPTSGSGNATFIFTAEANSSVNNRTAKVVISISDTVSQDITVIQKGLPITINLAKAGTLVNQFSEQELSGISHLTVTGEMDVRDFKLIRDKMPILEVLNLSGTTIKAYSGTEGTDEYTTDYQENEVPKRALENGIYDTKSKLTTLILPQSVTAIREEAFSQCRALKDFDIPPSVITISYYAFAGCTSLTDLIIPTSTTTIGIQAFRGCKSLKNIQLSSSITEIGNAAFETCDSLASVTLPLSLTTIKSRLFRSCIGLLSVDMGSAVTDIGEEAFFYCTSLKSIKIPSTVTSIGYNAFTYCYSLTSINSYPVNPPDLRNSGVVFANIDLNKCILYVPYGSKALYAAAEQWKDFKNIVEMNELKVSETEVSLEAAQGSAASIILSGNVLWTVGWDKPWLKVDPVTGTGTQTITFSAEANSTDISRTALVTVSATDIDPQTIVITQLAKPTGVDEMAQNRPSFNCYPNPFTQEVTVEIQNPKHTKITVDIYNMAGQRVKNLISESKAERLNISWDGTNELYQQVTPGIYICRMNEQTRQVVKGR